jgi:hypothetical protein
MVLGIFGGGDDVAGLIAKRNYAKAIQVIRAQLQQGHANPRLRVQLSDVLIMSGREREAVPVLIELADEYAAEHQAPKAIAMLKKIERIEPGRSDVTGRLARLIKDKAKPRRTTYQPKEGTAAEGYEPAGAVFSEEDFEEKKGVSDEEKIAAVKGANWVPDTHEAKAEEIPLIEIPPETDAPAAPVSDEAFRGQILDVIQDVLHKPQEAQRQAEGELVEAELAPDAGEIAESPLFSGFSHDELVAVMEGMRLLSFQPGDIILTEGDAGDSLFVMTEGVAKAFVRNTDGTGQRQVRTMQDGDFFGEISILSGKPRTATVTAATPVELLELDKKTLDGITSDHPGVRQVLEDFYIARASGEGS